MHAVIYVGKTKTDKIIIKFNMILIIYFLLDKSTSTHLSSAIFIGFLNKIV